MMDRPVDDTVAVAGEIGLSGELRSIPRADRRVSEASRLGFASCMIPEAAGDAGNVRSVKVVRPTNIAEAVRLALVSPDGATGKSSAAGVRSSM
jgi:DNA repair protein RadA/Sms